jgi:hypothetical protein
MAERHLEILKLLLEYDSLMLEDPIKKTDSQYNSL